MLTHSHTPRPRYRHAGPQHLEAGMYCPVQDRSCDPTHTPLGHATDLLFNNFKIGANTL